MSHLALQRVAVRMLYDPAFQAAVYRDTATALAGVDLSADERSWIAKPDPRAWRTDSGRRARSLVAMLQEYPASVAASDGGIAALDAFFSSKAFHTCVQDGGSLADAFGWWLEKRGGLAGEIAKLERAGAYLRRVRSAGVPRAGTVVKSAWIAMVGAPEGTLLAMKAASTRSASPTASKVEENVLVVREPAGAISMEVLPDALAALLAATPCTRDELLAVARKLGADPGEDEEIVSGLLADGVLL